MGRTFSLPFLFLFFWQYPLLAYDQNALMEEPRPEAAESAVQPALLYEAPLPEGGPAEESEKPTSTTFLVEGPLHHLSQEEITSDALPDSASKGDEIIEGMAQDKNVGPDIAEKLRQLKDSFVHFDEMKVQFWADQKPSLDFDLGMTIHFTEVFTEDPANHQMYFSRMRTYHLNLSEGQVDLEWVEGGAGEPVAFRQHFKIWNEENANFETAACVWSTGNDEWQSWTYTSNCPAPADSGV